MFRRFSIPGILFLLILCFPFGNTLFAQNDFLIVENIVLDGNKKTKARIIYQELDFSIGDTIQLDEIGERFLINQKRLLSTGLFNIVSFNFKNWNPTTARGEIHIEFRENWFLYPAPIFELADRNFNVWINEMNASFKRVNYGARITHTNFTGNRDYLKLVLQFGYTRKYEAEYFYPIVNKSQTIGLGGNIFYEERKEIGYITQGNILRFATNNDDILLRRFRIRGKLNYRPTIYDFHKFKIEFHRNSADEYVINELNPNYFLNNDTRIRFFLFEYEWDHDKRVFFFYPEGGYKLFFNIKKEGFGIFNDFNNLSTFVGIEKFFKPWPKWILGTKIKAKTNLIRNQIPFANNTALGYGEDFIRGYELYVIDGTDYIYQKSSLKFRLIDKLVSMDNSMPFYAFKKMQIQIFLSANFDYAYVNERDYIDTNEFNNRLIFGGGPGIDIILYNNFLFKIEYSFNHLGEKGLFLSNAINF